MLKPDPSDPSLLQVVNITSKFMLQAYDGGLPAQRLRIYCTVHIMHIVVLALVSPNISALQVLTGDWYASLALSRHWFYFTIVL